MTFMPPPALDDRLKAAFADALQIPADTVQDDLAYRSIPQWTSVAHMALIAAIEEQFDIMIDTDDVIDMSSFAKARQIVTRYVAVGG